MAEIVFFIMLVVVVPAMIGFYMAKKRGKNPFIWGLLSICPFALYILKVQYKPLDKKDDKVL